MADAYSCRPQSSDCDGPSRPPTFVQIRPPAPAGGAGRKLGMVGVGLALVMAVGWAALRMGDDEPAAIEMTEAAIPVTDIPPPPPAPADLQGELAARAIATAMAEPAWSRESLIDRMSPFDLSVPVHPPSSTPPAEAGDATNDGSVEVSVQLGKGDTIGSALKKLGFPADAIADVISALAPHVRLQRLPIGLGMTVHMQPPGEESARPILQALTLRPDGRREIKVERDGDGNYAVERRR